LRGIYLDTQEEVEAVYSQKNYLQNPKRLGEFNVLYSYISQFADKDDPLDPNDAERLMRLYNTRIQQGDLQAIWHWHVFENNLMEEDPANLLDPNYIDTTFLPEAQSVAYFETTFWLHGSYDEPVTDLLGQVNRLVDTPVWICQGRYDEVCPERYAHRLVDALEEARVPHAAFFVQGGHEDTDPVLELCLKQVLHEYEETR
jgi:pimeloyl-ACP methyl ester carboxylesterase